MDQNQRKQLLLMIMGGLFTLVVVVFITTIFIRSNNATDEVSIKRRQLAKIEALVDEIAKNRAATSEFEDKISGKFPVLTHIENLVKNSGLPKPAMKVRSGTDSEYFDESSWELRLDKLNLKQVLALLSSVENSTPPRFLKVRYMSIKTPYSEKDRLDLILQVSAFFKKEAEEAKPPEGATN